MAAELSYAKLWFDWIIRIRISVERICQVMSTQNLLWNLWIPYIPTIFTIAPLGQKVQLWSASSGLDPSTCHVMLSFAVQLFLQCTIFLSSVIIFMVHNFFNQFCIWYNYWPKCQHEVYSLFFVALGLHLHFLRNFDFIINFVNLFHSKIARV